MIDTMEMQDLVERQPLMQSEVDEEAVVDEKLCVNYLKKSTPAANYFQYEDDKFKPSETRILIWKRDPTKNRIGHIAVEFEHDEKCTYISYWPIKTVKNTIIPVTADWHDTLLVDLQAEQGDLPDYIFKFYTLDTKQMLEKLKQLEKKAKEWYALGSVFTDDPNVEDNSKTKYNCVSIAILILKAGGLEQLADQSIFIEKRDKDLHNEAPYPYPLKKSDKNFKQCCQFCHHSSGLITLQTFRNIKKILLLLFAFSTIGFFCLGAVKTVDLVFPDPNNEHPSLKLSAKIVSPAILFLVLTGCIIAIQRKLKKNLAEKIAEKIPTMDPVYMFGCVLADSVTSPIARTHDAIQGLKYRTLRPDSKNLLDVIQQAKRNEIKKTTLPFFAHTQSDCAPSNPMNLQFAIDLIPDS